MKSLSSYISYILVGIFVVTSSAIAQTGTTLSMEIPVQNQDTSASVITGALAPTNTVEPSELELLGANAVDAHTVDITFNMSMIVDSVRVSLVDQKTKLKLYPDSYIADPKNAAVIRVHFEEDIQGNSTYVLTVHTSMSQSGKTITSGVKSVYELHTSTIASSNNAAPNTPAPSTPESNTPEQNVPVVEDPTLVNNFPTNESEDQIYFPPVASGSDVVQADPALETSELPATGVSTLVIIAVVLAISGVIFIAQRKHS